METSNLDGPCFACGQETNSLAANPGLWPLELVHFDGPTLHRRYHIDCLYKIVGDSEKRLEVAHKLAQRVRSFPRNDARDREVLKEFDSLNKENA